MGVCWTKEQQQVIELRDRNLLVSAAAGSGKTAVLVERIIARMTRDALPVDVDQLLIVTYTEAAAAEMKERIRDAIEQQLEEHPQDEHLQKQATLVHYAMITTIHSFCLSVIREHFHTIDLDPGFRIAEEGELKLLKNDVLETLLEECYAEGKEDFLEFVECFAAGRDDKKIEELILQLFECSRSYPDPEDWLRKCASTYHMKDVGAMEEAAFMEAAGQQMKHTLNDAAKDLQLAIKICEQPDGPKGYLPALESDMEIVDRLCKAKGMEVLYDCVSELRFKRLAPNRDQKVSAELQELVKNLRARAKESIESMISQYLFQEPEELRKDMNETARVAEVLVKLVQNFADAFAVQKAAKNLIDFGDMEQFALRILTDHQEGKLVPSQVAKEYQLKFAEVMIDEYQDSNLIQEAILTSIASVERGRYNLFMVGDVKQSIYRFRLSRPELFMEKFHRYSLEEAKEQRIDLHKNFRSRSEVLCSVNYIFRQIMTQKLGGITYDDSTALYVGASYEDTSGNDTEVLLVNTDRAADQEEESEAADRELEARAAARRIKELVGSYQVLEKKTGTYRSAAFGDIVILFRSLKGWTDVFAEVLNREGIPTSTGSKEGYFEVREVALLLDYLKILNNPRQDLPLTAVLSSFFGKLEQEELAAVRKEYPGIPFHEAVFCYGKEKTGDTQAKLTAFFDTLTLFRAQVPYTAIHELLWNIIEETGYGHYVKALPGGVQRKANVEMLVEKAMAFERTSYKGLFNFIRYIEQLRKYNVDYGEANIASESACTVRLMSIHKSKGLEFPVVFVAGMSKGFNMQDVRGSIVIHPVLGIGMDAVDLKRRTKSPTLLKKIIQKQVTLENLGEELRVLYVALTRAREKLIMLGTVSGFEKKLQNLSIMKHQTEQELSFTTLCKANRYYDWVLPALARNPAFATIWEAYGMTAPITTKEGHTAVPIQVHLIELTELVAEEVMEEHRDIMTKELLKSVDEYAVYDAEWKRCLEQQFSFQYRYQQEQNFQMKFTVSELKKRAYLEEESGAVPVLPKFRTATQEVHGAFRGSAYHKLLELLDFTGTYTEDEIDQSVQRFCAEGRLLPEMAACIDAQDILAFLQSPIGIRMQEAAKKSRLFVEQPFVLGVPAAEIYEQDSEEIVIVQGIIDVYFEEEDTVVILDYKTDHVQRPVELVERYQSQLAYYAKALEQLTGKQVKEQLIYSFAFRQVISVN